MVSEPVLKAMGGCFFLTAQGLLPSQARQEGNLPRCNLLHEHQGGAENTQGRQSARNILQLL